MQLNSLKAAIVTPWLLALSVVSLVADITSWSGWTIVAALATLPPAMLLWWWRDPPQTLSESIHDAR